MTTVEAIRGTLTLTDSWTPVLDQSATKTESFGQKVKKVMGDAGNAAGSAFRAGLQKGTDMLGKDLENTIKGLESFSNKASTLGRTMLPVSLAITGIGAASIKMSTDLNASMASIATLIPNNIGRITQLKGEVQGMAIEFGKSTTDISGGLYQLISTLGDSAENTKILEINVKAAAAGLATTTDAINLTTSVTKTFGDTSAAAFQKVSDLAFRTADIGKTTFPELAASIGGVAPLAKETGIAMEEMFAVIATATGITGSTSEVVTQMSSAITALVSPSKEMKEIYAQMGVTSGQALIQQRGLVGALQAVAEKAKENGTALIDLVGRKEAWILTSSLAGSQAQNFSTNLDKLTNAAGATDRAFEQQTNGINKVGFQWSVLTSKLQVAGQQLGDALGPILLKTADNMQPLLDKTIQGITWFGQLPQPIQTTVITIAGLTAVAAPAAIAIGGISNAISVLLPLVTGITVAGTAMTAAIAALAATAVAYVAVVWRMVEAQRALFQATYEGKGFSDRVSAWWTALKGGGAAVEEVKPKVDAASDAQKKLAEQIKGATEEAKKQIEALIKQGTETEKPIKPTKALTAELNRQAEAQKKLREEKARALREFNNWRGEREIQAAEDAMKAREEQARQEREYRNWVGQRIIENAELELKAIEAAKKARADQAAEYRAYMNWVGERNMEAEAAEMARKDWKGGAAKNFTGVFGNLSELIQQSFTGGGGLEGAFKALGMQLAEAIRKPLMASLNQVQQKSVMAGAAAAGAIGGVMGGGTGATIATVASSLGGAALAASAWGTSMAAAGMAGAVALSAATLGIGLAAVGIYVLIKRWKGVSKEVKEARKEVAEFQEELRKTMTAQQVAESGGEKWAATIITTRDALRGLGMDAAEADRKAQELSKALWDDKNPERARAAMDAISKVVGAWQAKLKAGNEEMRTLLGQATELGVKLPDSILESITQMAQLGVLTEENTALLKELTGAADVDWKKMQDAAQRYGIDVNSLGQQYQGLRLTAAAQAIIDDYDLLIRGGADVGAVLFGMREEISKLVQESLKFGTTIPENMRPWIAELAKTGNLVDENGEKLTDLSRLQFGDPLINAFDRITGKLQELIDAIIGKGGLNAAINSIPSNVRVDVDLNYRGTENGGDYTGGDPGYATGTIGRHGKWFKGFGSGTVTTLHNQEAVITPEQAPAFAMDVLANNGAGGGSAMNTMPVTVQIGDRFFFQTIAREVGEEWRAIVHP